MSVPVLPPRLVLVPDFSGGLDIELRMHDEAFSRVAVHARGVEVPSLYAPLFEDPFAPAAELEETLSWWLERASPAPSLCIRLEDGDRPIALGSIDEVEARLTLSLNGRTVVIMHGIAGGEEIVPLGEALIYRFASGTLARLANPAAWRMTSRAPALGLEVAPTTRNGRAFRPPGAVRLGVETFNEAGVAVPWPLPEGIALEVDGRSVAADERSPACAVRIETEADGGGAKDSSRSRFAEVSLVPQDGPYAEWDVLAALPADRALLGANPIHGRWEATTARRLRDAAVVLNRIDTLVGTKPGNPGNGDSRLRHSLRLDREAAERRIPEIHSLCRGHALTLHYNAAEVLDGSLDIRARATEEDADDGQEEPSIDWFELRPEVSCGGFRLTERQWAEILERGWFCAPRSAGNRPIVVDAASRERLGRVLRSAASGLAPTKALVRAGTATRDIRYTGVHKMRILNWLSLARAGAALDLPPDDRAVIDALLHGRPFSPAPLPLFLNARLRPYQEAGYQWLCFLYRLGLGAVLADDMGLGKTLQTIAFLAAVREGRAGIPAGGAPHLVVVPPTLVFNWAAEIRRFYPRFRVLEFTGARRRADRIRDAHVVITTYDMVRREARTLGRTEFDVLVFDEAQMIKNHRSERTAAARSLHSRFTLCLTGTPVENHLGELHTIVDLALPGLLGDHRSFVDDVGDDPEHPRVARARPFLLRRTKERILPELPPRIESDIFLDLTEAQKELYTRTVAEVREEVAEAYATQTGSQAAISALAALTRLRQACVSPALLLGPGGEPGPKIDHLVSSIEELHGEGHAALVFSQFTSALDVAEGVLRKHGIPLLRLDGATPQAERRVIVERFQSADGPPVLLVSLRTGAAGLNLTRASWVFHLDPWWNPAVESQASARAHRIGQTTTVFVQRLLMRHTLEEKMMDLKARKQALYDRIMEPAEARAESVAQDPSPLRLNREDLNFLLG